MKRTLAMLAGLACLIGVSYFVGSACAQPAKVVDKEPPHKIALIDMSEVIKGYTKFQGMQEDLKGKIKEKEAEGKLLTDKVKVVVDQLNSGTIVKGSADYQALEKDYLRLQGDMQALKQSAQLDLMREEARNYHNVYLDVQAAVAKFAKHFGYTLVLRFSKEELDSNDPQKVIQGLGRQVIYHEPGDDITEGVLKFLNNSMTAKGGPAPSSTKPRAVTPASGTSETRSPVRSANKP